MQAIALDILEKAAFNSAQARAVIQAIEAEVDARKDVLATKEDWWKIKSELELRIEQSKNDIIKWVVAIVVSQAIVVLGGVVFLVGHVR